MLDEADRLLDMGFEARLVLVGWLQHDWLQCVCVCVICMHACVCLYVCMHVYAKVMVCVCVCVHVCAWLAVCMSLKLCMILNCFLPSCSSTH